MCFSCDQNAVLSRKSFLRLAGAGLLSSTLPSYSYAAAAKSGPALSGKEALEKMMAGNDRYARDEVISTKYSDTRAALAKSQNPFACVLSCSDSRVSPELAFDSERGDLFVARIAGNYTTPQTLASLEYGVAILGARLLMVLGHTKCGALIAAIDAEINNTSFPGHIQTISTDLVEPVRAAIAQNPAPKDLELAAITENVRMNVEFLREATPLLRPLAQGGELLVVGGIYDLETGRVGLIDA